MAGPRETFSWGPQTFSQGASGEKNFEFFFSKWYILVYCIFLADGGALHIAGPGVANPPTPPSLRA